MKKFAGFLIMIIMALTTSVFAHADIMTIVKEDVKDRMKLTGKFDILVPGTMDEIKRLAFPKYREEIEEDGDHQVVLIDFKTPRMTEEHVVKAYVLNDEDNGYVVDRFELVVEEPAEPADPDRVYTEEEVRSFMKSAMDEKSDDGKLVIYDPKAERVRFWEFVDFAGDMRNFGKIFINGMTYKDSEDDSTIVLDVTVTNDNGELKYKSHKVK